MKIIIAIGLCVIGAAPLWADEKKGVQKETDLSLVGTTEPGVALCIEQRFIFPVLRGETPLTADNNVTMKFRGEFTPSSLQIMTDTIWTPFAAINLSIGAQLGAGWNYRLAGSFISGLGIYQRNNNNEDPAERARGPGFDGVLWNVHSGMRLQFDFAALFPGDWNHVVVRLDNIMHYQNYTAAQGAERWYFRNDDDLYENCFSYYFAGVLGYQMPLFFNLAALMFELSLPVYNPQSGKAFPEREPEMILSLVTNWTLGKRFSLMGLCQFQDMLQRPVTEDYRRQWQFFRVMIVGTWRLF